MADIDYETRQRLEGNAETQLRRLEPSAVLRLQLVAIERQLVEHEKEIIVRRERLDVDRKALGNWVRGRGILKAKAHLVRESIEQLGAPR